MLTHHHSITYFPTVDVAAVFPKELQSVWMVVLHRLRDVDDVSIAVVIPVAKFITVV